VFSGAGELVSQAAAQLGVGVDDWMCCSSMQQLQEAVMDVRKQQLQHPELQQVGVSPVMNLGC